MNKKSNSKNKQSKGMRNKRGQFTEKGAVEFGREGGEASSRNSQTRQQGPRNQVGDRNK